VPDVALRLIAELTAAIGAAHTPRALVRAFATSLATTVPVQRVELAALTVALERAGEDWVPSTAGRSKRAVELAHGLWLVAERALPAELTAPAVRSALDQVVEMATRHVTVVQKLAERSRLAHVETRELRADLQRLEPTGAIVARSAAMRDTLERVRLVAAHPTTVLLTGESGTGKEVLAREIHRRSQRAHRAMLHVNCGAIAEHLVESELFGHERGAFTSADRTHVGLFERAHRGTLLLDEVGELPLAAQAKLLRVLQERTVRRVGGTAEISVDVRVIAATHRSLAEMVAARTFREDLMYRLDVFAIHVPPLRERVGDLAPLVHAIVGELAARLAIEPPPVTRTLLEALGAHTWPGNVRELANVLETALILGDRKALVIPRELVRAPRRAGFALAMRATIEEALRLTRGKIYGDDGAAARLALPPATLQSKMKKLGIDRRSFR